MSEFAVKGTSIAIPFVLYAFSQMCAGETSVTARKTFEFFLLSPTTASLPTCAYSGTPISSFSRKIKRSDGNKKFENATALLA